MSWGGSYRTLDISMSAQTFSLTEALDIFTMHRPINCGGKPLCETLGGIYVTITVVETCSRSYDLLFKEGALCVNQHHSGTLFHEQLLIFYLGMWGYHLLSHSQGFETWKLNNTLVSCQLCLPRYKGLISYCYVSLKVHSCLLAQYDNHIPQLQKAKCTPGFYYFGIQYFY